MSNAIERNPQFWRIVMLLTVGIASGCGGNAREQESIEALRALDALVVLDVDKHASSLVLPSADAKIQEALPWLLNLRRLKSLSAMNCEIEDDALVTVGRLRTLTNVDLSNTTVTDRGIEHLASLSKLASLNLAQSEVTGDCLRTLGALPQLDVLLLSKIETSGGFAELAKSKNLTWLTLSHLRLSDEDAASLADCPSLKRLTLTTEVEISPSAQALLESTGIKLDLPSARPTD